MVVSDVSIWSKIKHKTKKIKEERGSFVMTALVIIPTFMFGTAIVGTAADAYLAKVQMQKAADASAVAIVYQIREWLLDPNAKITALGKPEKPGEYLRFDLNDDGSLAIDLTDAGWDIIETIREEYVYQNTRKTDAIIPGTFRFYNQKDKKKIVKGDNVTNFAEVNVGRRVPVWGGKFFGLFANNKKGVLSIPVIATARAGFPQQVAEINVGHRPPLAVIIPLEDGGGYFTPRKGHLVNLSLRPADLGTSHASEELGADDAKQNGYKRNKNFQEQYKFSPILGLLPIYYHVGMFKNYHETTTDYHPKFFRGRLAGQRYTTQANNTTFQSRMDRYSHGSWQRYGDWLDGNIGDTKEIPPENNYKMDASPIALGPDINHVDASWFTHETPPKPIMRDALKRAMEKRIDEARKLAKKENIPLSQLKPYQDPRVIVMPMYKVQQPYGVPPIYGKYVHATGQPFALKGMPLEDMRYGPQVNDPDYTKMYSRFGYVAIRIDSVDYGLYRGSYWGHLALNNNVLSPWYRDAFLRPNIGQIVPGNTAWEETNPEHRESGVTWQGVFFMQNLEIHGEVVEVSGQYASASDTAVFNLGSAEGADAISYDVRLLPNLTAKELRKLGYEPPVLEEDEGW